VAGATVSAGAGRLALVTGAAGFLGSHLVASLLGHGWAVRALDDVSTGRLDNLAAVQDRIDWRPWDVRDAGTLAAAVAGADVVFHLAARPSEAASFEDPVTSHAVNAEGTLRALEAARAAGVRRFVHASSFRVYGAGAEGPLCEASPPAPASPYAVQKLCGEVYCGLYHRLHALETVSLRYFPTFGPRQSSASGYALPALEGARAGARTPEVARALRGFVFVEDAVRATELAADAERAVGSVLNVANAQGDGPADPSRAKACLGFEARVSIEEGLERTAAWLREREGTA